MTARQFRALRMLGLGMVLMLLAFVVPEPLPLVFTVAGFIAVVMA